MGAHLCLSQSDRSAEASPRCPCGPSPYLRGSAGELAASAGASALAPGSQAGADSYDPSPLASAEGRDGGGGERGETERKTSFA